MKWIIAGSHFILIGTALYLWSKLRDAPHKETRTLHIGKSDPPIIASLYRRLSLLNYLKKNARATNYLEQIEELDKEIFGIVEHSEDAVLEGTLTDLESRILGIVKLIRHHNPQLQDDALKMIDSILDSAPSSLSDQSSSANEK